MEEIVVGKVYMVRHIRKGNFKMKVLAISGDWISGKIVEGTACHIVNPNGVAGEDITVRKTLTSFTEEK